MSHSFPTRRSSDLSALDPFLRVQMRAELRRWQNELGLTFIHVTHSQEEAMALADMVVVMNHGKIEQTGSAHEVYNRPHNEFVARFLGGHNVLDDEHNKFVVRSDHLKVSRQASPQSIQATVADIEYQGIYVLLNVQTKQDRPLNVMMLEASFDQSPLELGDQIHLTWNPSQAHFFAPTCVPPTSVSPKAVSFDSVSSPKELL